MLKLSVALTRDKWNKISPEVCKKKYNWNKNKANVITSNYLELNYIPLFDMYYDYYFQE